MKTYFSVNRLIISTLLIGVLFFLSHCSTKKNTPINRAYHTVTSHYNINFNGKEALKAVEEVISNIPEKLEVKTPISKDTPELKEVNAKLEKANENLRIA
ncbi:MAG TPA: hypothetical protein PLZ46_06175, partial [Bacteroidales bacterium]|nr:hypothetical protein [Bacteroidales bacterium]